ncbi:MAG: ABC transporter permease subunit [Anaerolineales bacterium]
MNIYLRELKANLKSLLIWCGVLGLLIVIAITKYQAYAQNPEMLAILDSMPKAMLEAFSMTAFNLTTLTGFFGVMFIYFGLMVAIAAAMWGSDILSKEERNKTVEFSLVLPVSRSRVVTAKALAALTNLALFVLVTWGFSLLAAQKYAPEPAFYDFLALEMQGMFLIGLVFLALGLLLGAAMQQYKRSGSLAIAIILTAYSLSVASGLDERLEFLRYFTPFQYFDAAKLLHDGHLDGLYVLLSLVLVAVMLAAGYWRYNRRDLYI